MRRKFLIEILKLSNNTKKIKKNRKIGIDIITNLNRKKYC